MAAYGFSVQGLRVFSVGGGGNTQIYFPKCKMSLPDRPSFLKIKDLARFPGLEMHKFMGEATKMSMYYALCIFDQKHTDRAAFRPRPNAIPGICIITICTITISTVPAFNPSEKSSEPDLTGSNFFRMSTRVEGYGLGS